MAKRKRPNRVAERKPSKRKFYQTVWTVTVLSEEEPGHPSLEQIAHQIYEGDWSGEVERHASIVLSAAQAATALVEQANAPAFFNLDHAGKEWD